MSKKEIHHAIDLLVEQERELLPPSFEEPEEFTDTQYQELATELHDTATALDDLAGQVPSNLPPVEFIRIRSRVEEFRDYIRTLAAEFVGQWPPVV